ncbi:MAG TPA: choline-sulfatase [Dongiaceae bacterium]
MTRRPNILFVMADQMAPAFLPIHGHKLVKAPNIEALADRGTVFESAYCASPLCAPSRFSMMAGRRPAGIGAFDNAADFAADIPTFAHYLRQAGYRTALSGKMHFCGPDQLHGFEERLTTDIYPADFGWTPDWTQPEIRPSWYHNMLSVTQAGPCRRSNQLDFDEEVVYTARRWLFDQARGTDDRPFCLVVSMTHPHDPYAILPEYWNRYREDEIDLPRLATSPDQDDPHWRRLRHVSDMDSTEITEAHIRGARRAYYGAISYVDDQLGHLVKTLGDCGLEGETITLFTADHGDMLGERGLWYKMNWHENAARVPLIIGFPGDATPRRVAQSVSTIDLLPTLAEIAGDGAAPDYAAPIDGRSLLPHIAGSGGHDEVLGEYFGEGAIAPLLMIRRGTYKYIRSRPDPEQLYDLAADPLEQVNLAKDPAHAKRLADFRAEALARWDEEALRAQVIASQQRRHLVAASLLRGRHSAWDHQPKADASRSYMRNNIELDDLEYRSRLPHVGAPPKG